MPEKPPTSVAAAVHRMNTTRFHDTPAQRLEAVRTSASSRGIQLATLTETACVERHGIEVALFYATTITGIPMAWTWTAGQQLWVPTPNLCATPSL